ncbi:MAG: restriction endonuclease subunit S [Lentisphaeria bacterium]|nr:restriction endonuclease subunit S [Lentisphaeria bacterium]
MTDMPNGYKMTEVGVIPEDWEVKTLGELGTFSKGQGIRKNEAISGNLACIRYGEIYTHHNDVIRTYNSFISPIIARQSKRLSKGDILFAGSGETKEEIGKAVAFVGDDEVYAGGDIVILSQKSECPEYLGYLLNTPIASRQKASVGQGDAVVHISASALRAVAIPLPPLSEQRAIAAALSDVDELLAGLDRLIAKKRDLKQAAMQQLLTGQTRLPGFQGEWETKRLGDIARIIRGASPRPIDSPVWFTEHSSIGWVRISDVTRSVKFLRETVQRLSQLGVQHSRFVAPNSLIMSICATVGRPIITQIKVCIHDGFVVFDNLQSDKFFIYYFLQWIEPNWCKSGQTGSQMNLNTGLINATAIKLPSISEQTAIASVLSDMDAEIDVLERRRAKTADIKQAMMQELLTGRTRLV